MVARTMSITAATFVVMTNFRMVPFVLLVA